MFSAKSLSILSAGSGDFDVGGSSSVRRNVMHQPRDSLARRIDVAFADPI